MPDMTIREAVQILSAVSQQLRAAKLLEEALKVGLNIEGIVKAKTSEKGELEDQVSALHTRLNELTEEIEQEEVKLTSKLEEASRLIEAGKLKIRGIEVETDKKMKEIKVSEKEQHEELEKKHLAWMKDMEEIKIAKQEEVASIEVKLKTAKADMAKARERLG